MNFHKEDIEKISEFYGIDCEYYEGSYTWKLSNPKLTNQIFLTIANIQKELNIPANIVSVQTSNGFFELHNCNHFFIFPPDEIFFISENEDKLSCLIIGRNSTCSLFSNIEKSIFEQNITELPQPILLAAMQLSIIKSVQ